MKGSVIVTWSIEIGLLHAHESHLQENVEISRDLVTRHKDCNVSHTDYVALMHCSVL